jgi:hypothetical protein
MRLNKAFFEKLFVVKLSGQKAFKAMHPLTKIPVASKCATADSP